MDQEARENLLAIKKPIEYASRNSFANLSKVKDLNSFIPAMIDAVIPSLSDSARPCLDGIKKDFKRFDSFPTPQKKRVLSLSLEKIDELLKIYTADTMPEKSPDEGVSAPPLSEKSPSLNPGDIPIRSIKGVGPKTAALLNKRGIFSALDLLYFFPFRYEDRRNIVKIAAIETGKVQQVVGDVLLCGEAPLFKRRKKILEAVLDDGSGALFLKWFNYNGRYMKTLLKKGVTILASGDVSHFGGRKEMLHPEIEIVEKRGGNRDDLKKIVPFYHLTEGLSQKTLRALIPGAARDYSSFLMDGIPESINIKRGLIPLKDAIREVHIPSNKSDIFDIQNSRTDAHKRLIYDEFFFLQIAVAQRHSGAGSESGVMIRCRGKLKSAMLKALPFTLTDSQERVIAEIEEDLVSGAPMQRLLQGDVGCGKTVVAVIAALEAVDDGYQVAIMAPTEILAEQHFMNIHRFTNDMGVRTELLKGSLKTGDKKAAIERIREGSADIVIGTHAIIQEGVRFKKLGLAIIDEQHRFGVIQKARLKLMGPTDRNIKATPNMLVMTATPIPRALSMTVYGDLDLSVIDKLPPGRHKVETRVYREPERSRVYEIIRTQLSTGRQAYVVYPLIEESEKLELMNATGMFEKFKKIFKEFRVGLIHGRMNVADKEAVMDSFKKRGIDLLVSTTVIEVGIDVPNASVILIEHAERFGLSQLHQLRGRVGRGPGKSTCLLLAQYRASKEAAERLSIMEKCSDGFEISEADLRVRGPGDMFGTRQSGIPDFRIANILRDEKLLKAARKDAFEIINNDPELEEPGNRIIRDALKLRGHGRVDFIGTG